MAMAGWRRVRICSRTAVLSTAVLLQSAGSSVLRSRAASALTLLPADCLLEARVPRGGIPARNPTLRGTTCNIRNEAPSHVSLASDRHVPGETISRVLDEGSAGLSRSRRWQGARTHAPPMGSRWRRSVPPEEVSKFLLKPERNLSRHARPCGVKTREYSAGIGVSGGNPPQTPSFLFCRTGGMLPVESSQRSKRL